ncbi:MAG TPA: hypothetical protein VLT45_23640, partial [Kofleriaceae bacterium]|nr:hypothetical protein [Kofleriaceae bacterium]
MTHRALLGSFSLRLAGSGIRRRLRLMRRRIRLPLRACLVGVRLRVRRLRSDPTLHRALRG